MERFRHGWVYGNLFKRFQTLFGNLFSLSLVWVKGLDFGRIDGLGSFHLRFVLRICSPDGVGGGLV